MRSCWDGQVWVVLSNGNIAWNQSLLLMRVNRLSTELHHQQTEGIRCYAPGEHTGPLCQCYVCSHKWCSWAQTCPHGYVQTYPHVSIHAWQDVHICWLGCSTQNTNVAIARIYFQDSVAPLFSDKDREPTLQVRQCYFFKTNQAEKIYSWIYSAASPCYDLMLYIKCDWPFDLSVV